MINPKDLAVVLRFLNPDADYIVRDDSDGSDPYIEAWNSLDTQPTQSEIDTAEPAAMASLRIDQLKLYTEESGLRYGCGILDPLTGEQSGDSSQNIDVIRQQTGQSRNHLVYLKRDGTEAQKLTANNCQAVEENLSVVVAQIILAIQAGNITTEVEIDSAINAIVITY